MFIHDLCSDMIGNANDIPGKEGNGEPAKPKEKYNGSHMLPIMIVLGIMFIGMCVALNLFSRARFRQSRSGIFSKPHLIKFNNSSNSNTASGKKRRSSPPNPNRGPPGPPGAGAVGGGGGGGVGPSTAYTSASISAPDADVAKNGSYISIALES
ncbi:unnamed protein product [Medioppia subpectinata]|uniref:Uncharacterized protein n=1 Tax=Medioppia subpectinata TaxID=1979941 RepID=A0A7R9KRT7_9ACAR|nr:unnamed protein product [Medioppia subpectinata]CAG2108677.1 unnamed protein product [Medioppia subpectinata]